MTVFANGSEFEAWKSAWCDSCKVDFDTCPVMDDALMTGDSDKLRKGPFWSPQTVRYCLDYERNS